MPKLVLKKSTRKMVLKNVKPASMKLTPKKSYPQPKYGKLV